MAADQFPRHAIGLALDALHEAPRRCQYHGKDWEKLGFEWGLPRCDSCKLPYRVDRAINALNDAVRWADAS